MSIETFIAKISVQTAVYWAGPTPNGYGGFTFESSSPREINVRWENITELITAADGERYATKAKIFVNEDVDVNGFLFLGTLDDLDSGEEEDPREVRNAFPIRRFDKTPMIRKTDEFVRMAYI